MQSLTPLQYRLSQLTQQNRDVLRAVLNNPGTLFQITAIIGASFDQQIGVQQDAEYLLAARLSLVEKSLSALIDEGHVLRSPGSRETSIYQAS